MSSQFLSVEGYVHKGTNTIDFIQLSDMSEFIFVLLAQEHLPQAADGHVEKDNVTSKESGQTPERTQS